MGKTYYHCPIEAIVDVIGGKWKALILWHLQDQTRRPSELKRLIPGITQKMLVQQLKALEKLGMIKRIVYAQVPPRVEYSMTLAGGKLKPFLQDMCSWGRVYVDSLEIQKREMVVGFD